MLTPAMDEQIVDPTTCDPRGYLAVVDNSHWLARQVLCYLYTFNFWTSGVLPVASFTCKGGDSLLPRLFHSSNRSPSRQRRTIPRRGVFGEKTGFASCTMRELTTVASDAMAASGGGSNVSIRKYEVPDSSHMLLPLSLFIILCSATSVCTKQQVFALHNHVLRRPHGLYYSPYSASSHSSLSHHVIAPQYHILTPEPFDLSLQPRNPTTTAL